MAASALRRRPPPFSRADNLGEIDRRGLRGGMRARSRPIVLLPRVDTDRQILEHLEPHVRETEPDGAAAMLALVARDGVRLEADALSAAVRRALLVLAAGGDLRRELSLDDRAVTGLAEDLDDAGRRAELTAALEGLRATAEDLPATTAALDALLADEDRAWRALAAALLADELTQEK
jgi:hypothetical protein